MKYDVVWLAGVFEKGGSVSIKRSRSKKKTRPVTVKVRLRSNDHLLLTTVLEVVNRERLAAHSNRMGRWDNVKAPHRSWRSANDPYVRWEVEWHGESARSLIVSLLPHLHPHRAAKFARVLAGISG